MNGGLETSASGIGTFAIQCGERPGGVSCMAAEAIGDFGQKLAGRQIVHAAFKVSERKKQGLFKVFVRNDRIGNEGKGRRILAQSLTQHGRLKIEHAVDEPFLGAGSAIMKLVWMQYDDIARCRISRHAAIGEGLDPGNGKAQRIGVVTMGCIGVAVETSADAGNAGRIGCGHDAACLGPVAQTSKTLQIDLIYLRSHDLSLSVSKTGANMFDTKIVIVLRDDLAAWQALNVTAFLATGIAGQMPEIIGEDYVDRDGHIYNPISVQPMIILEADGETMSKVHRRSLEREVRSSLYVEEMFATGHDAANRAVFAEFGPDDAKVVGIAFRAEKKVADKISKGAKMHR